MSILHIVPQMPKKHNIDVVRNLDLKQKSQRRREFQFYRVARRVSAQHSRWAVSGCVAKQGELKIDSALFSAILHQPETASGWRRSLRRRISGHGRTRMF